MDDSRQDSRDDRYFPRWDVENRLIFHRGLNSNSQEGKTVDLSCSGIRFKTDEDVQIGQKLKMNVYFAIDHSVEVNGDVLWIKSKDQFKEVGVRFYNTSDEVQDAILEHAFESEKNKKVQNLFEGWNNK